MFTQFVPEMMGYTRPLAQYPLGKTVHKEGLLSCALLHKTEDCAPAPIRQQEGPTGSTEGGLRRLC